LGHPSIDSNPGHPSIAPIFLHSDILINGCPELFIRGCPE
jgi:hypothetical protein